MSNFQMPIQLMRMLKGGNPQQIAMNLLQQNSNGNPMLENLLNLANDGNNAAVEQVCRNILTSKGYNPDELMKSIQDQFG